MVEQEVDLLGLDNLFDSNNGTNPSNLQNNIIVPIPFKNALVPVPEPRIGQWTTSPNTYQSSTPPFPIQDILLRFNENKNQNDIEHDKSTSQELRGQNHQMIPIAISNQHMNHYLGNKSFAPPPLLPPNISVPRFDFTTMDQNDERDATLPRLENVLHSGRIMGRVSLKSLVTKNWKELFWIVYQPANFICFRCKEDYFDWLLNSQLESTERSKLVKLHVDFQRDPSSGIRGYQSTDIKKKTYRCGALHQFKLDSMTSFGPSLIAAFGSRSHEDAHQLHILLKELTRDTHIIRRGK